MSKSAILLILLTVFIGPEFFKNAYAMGLRTPVALPVEKNGTIVRFTVETTKSTNTSNLLATAAYGLAAKHTLLFGLPYILSSTNDERVGDISFLYRYIAVQNDRFSGSDRLGLLGGLLLPREKEREAAAQLGLVFTRFKNRHEIDMDIIFQSGLNGRPDSARYDVSWQYRLLPGKRPDWGLPRELNSVLELNGRWLENEDIVHQLTVGMQWIDPAWVIEGGFVEDIDNGDESRIILGTRFHF